MLSLALARLKPDSPAPFPLYIFLQKNNRMVPVRLQGDSLGEEQYQELLRNNYNELWIPKTHEAEVNAFLDYLEKTGSFPNAETDSKKDVEPTSEPEVSAEEKDKNEMALLAKAMLRELRSMKARGMDAQNEFAEKAKQFADQFLRKCAEQDSLYESVLLLRSIQNPTEHSVYVGSIAALLAASIDKSEAIDIANLLAASTFHDVGLKDVPTSILSKPEEKWKEAEHTIYEKHVEHSANILENSEDKIPKEVIRIVREHHERVDGRGFPNKLLEENLLRSSKLLILANEFNLLCEGRHIPRELSPMEALNTLQQQAPGGKKLQEQLDLLFQET